jgi:hypothetical protein
MSDPFKNHLPHIHELYAFLASDGQSEGLTAALFTDGIRMPLVAADQARVDSLREVAQMIANESGQTVTLCRFSVREDLEQIKPVADGGSGLTLFDIGEDKP